MKREAPANLVALSLGVDHGVLGLRSLVPLLEPRERRGALLKLGLGLKRTVRGRHARNIHGNEGGG